MCAGYSCGSVPQISTRWLRGREKTRNRLNPRSTLGASMFQKARGEESQQGRVPTDSLAHLHPSVAGRSGAHCASPCSRKMIRLGWENEILFIALKQERGDSGPKPALTLSHETGMAREAKGQAALLRGQPSRDRSETPMGRVFDTKADHPGAAEGGLGS